MNDPSDIRFASSLLDRLCAQPVGAAGERAVWRGHSLAELKRALRRDLEDLLNTRAPRTVAAADLDDDDDPAADPAAGAPGAPLSVYGLPDFTSANLGDPVDLEALRWTIEATVRRFEPRLGAARVSLAPVLPTERVLRFRIDAVLLAEVAPEPVQFETALEPATATFVMRGDRRE